MERCDANDPPTRSGSAPAGTLGPRSTRQKVKVKVGMAWSQAATVSKGLTELLDRSLYAGLEPLGRLAEGLAPALRAGRLPAAAALPPDHVYLLDGLKWSTSSAWAPATAIRRWDRALEL